MLKIDNLEHRLVNVVTLNDFMKAIRQNKTEASRILGLDRNTIAAVISSGQPAIIHVSNVNSNYTYRLLK